MTIMLVSLVVLIYLCKFCCVNLFCEGANWDFGQDFVLLFRLPVYPIVTDEVYMRI